MANESTTLAPVTQDAVVVANLTSDQIEVVKNTICSGYTDTEMRLYLHQCEKLSMDPLARETYTFKAGGKVIIGVGIDGFRKRANDTGCYMPGRPTEYYFDDGELSMARVHVKKLVGGDWHEFSEDAYHSEFRGNQPIWKEMPRVMLSKCAEARALRRAFPRELGGLYEPAERAAIERSAKAPRINQDPFAAPKPIDTTAKVISAERIVWECAKELGLTGEDVTAVLKEQRAPKDRNTWTTIQVAQYCEALKARAGAQGGGHPDYDGPEPPPIGGE